MRRREFITLVGGAALGGTAAWSVAARAQQMTRPVRIGFLASGAQESTTSMAQLDAIRQGLRDNGLTEGRDYILDSRFSAGDYDLFPEMARALAQAGARVILVNTIASVRAAQNVTPPVAVVMLAINDPVATGLVASLSRPGGNTTGMSTQGADFTPKLLEIQREVIPDAKLISVFFNPANPTNVINVGNLRTTAEAIGIRVQPVELKPTENLDAAFTMLAQRRPDALAVISDSGLNDLHDRIAALALAHRLPSFSSVSTYAEFGGLLGYGPSRRQMFIQACSFVKRILDGAKPSDLPVQQPTKFELIVNLRTASALGLTIPPSILARADKVIE